jgi:hypothetical protein
MSKRALVPTAPAAPARVITYIQPEPLPAHYLYSRAELAARRREQQAQVARWAVRQQALAERDRKVRRFMLGFGAVVGAGVLTGVALVGWIIYHALAGVGSAAWLALLGFAAVVVGPVALIGGHRCITVVKHWH